MTEIIKKIELQDAPFLSQGEDKNRHVIQELGRKLYESHLKTIAKKVPEGYSCAVLPTEGIAITAPNYKTLHAYIEENYKGKIFYVCSYVKYIPNSKKYFKFQTETLPRILGGFIFLHYLRG